MPLTRVERPKEEIVTIVLKVTKGTSDAIDKLAKMSPFMSRVEYLRWLIFKEAEKNGISISDRAQQ